MGIDDDAKRGGGAREGAGVAQVGSDVAVEQFPYVVVGDAEVPAAIVERCADKKARDRQTVAPGRYLPKLLERWSSQPPVPADKGGVNAVAV